VVVPLPGLPEVRPGDDLARLLLDGLEAAGERLEDGDVVAVTSKVVAKAEGRTVPLPVDPVERDRVRAETVAAETVRVVARRGPMVIAETRHGLVGANALVDASNTGGEVLVLLPRDPDASAARLRAALVAATGADVAVVVTDTLGRPWRTGHTDVAVGLAGMGAIEDYRGRLDGDGRLLEVTEMAVADEVAAAADLVKGKVTRTPAALLRGVPRPAGHGRARDLVRPASADLFRTASGPEDLLAFLEGGKARRFLPDPVDPAAIERAVLAAAAAPFPDGTHRFRVVDVASPAGRKRYLAALAAPLHHPRAGGADPAAARWQDLPGEAPVPPLGTPAPLSETPAPPLGTPTLLGEAPAPPRQTPAPLGETPAPPRGAPTLLGEAPVLLVPFLAPAEPSAVSGDAEAHASELLAAGGAVRALLLALHAQGLTGTFAAAGPSRREAATGALGLPAGWLALGTVAAGHPDPADAPEPAPSAALAEVLLRR